MSTFPRTPRLLKGGIVLLDPVTSAVQRVIPLQYNPDTLTRTLEAQLPGGEGGDRTEGLRYTGPPKETIKLEAELDATEQLEHAEVGEDQADLSLHAHLAALELIIYPSSSQTQEQKILAQAGMMDIAPMQGPLTLFVWSAKRVLPVRLTEFSITEEAFDTELNPVRAKVSLGMRVLHAWDLGYDHKGSSLFTVYHQEKERLAAQSPSGELGTLGIKGIT